MKYKSSGYGIYWSVVELLHEHNGSFELDDLAICSIAKDLNENPKIVTNVIDDCIKKFKLFKLEKGFLSSPRVDKNFSIRKEISTKKSAAGKASGEARRRASKQRTGVEQVFNGVQHNRTGDEQVLNDVQQPSNTIEQNEQRKGKEIKENSINTIIKPACYAQAELESMAKQAMSRLENLPDVFIAEESVKFANKYHGKEIKDFEKLISTWIKNHKVTSSSEQGAPQIIEIDGTKHKPKMNGSGWIYPTITGKQFDKNFTKVKLLDGTWQELSEQNSVLAKRGTLKPENFWKGRTK